MLTSKKCVTSRFSHVNSGDKRRTCFTIVQTEINFENFKKSLYFRPYNVTNNGTTGYGITVSQNHGTHCFTFSKSSLALHCTSHTHRCFHNASSTVVDVGNRTGYCVECVVCFYRWLFGDTFAIAPLAGIGCVEYESFVFG